MSSSVFSRFLRRVTKLLLRLILLVVLLLAGAIAYTNLFDLPGPLQRRILAEINRGPITVEAGSIRVHALTRVSVADVKIYSKHVLGKPFLAASDVELTVNPRDWFAGSPGIKAVFVSNAVVRPRQVRSSGRSGEVSSAPFQFPLTIVNCRVYDLNVDRLHTTFRLAGRKLDLDNIQAHLSRAETSGTASGNISYDLTSRKAALDIVSNIRPDALFTIIAAYRGHFLVKLLERFVFTGPPPRVQWKMILSTGGALYQYVSGTFRIRNVFYRGVYFSRADGHFSMEHTADELAVRVDRLFLVNSNGIADVTLDSQPLRKMLSFTASSSLSVMDMSQAAGIMTNFLAKHTRFMGPSTLTASGRVDLSPAHTNNNIKAVIKADNVQAFGFDCESGAADIFVKGRQVSLTNIVANTYGGFLGGHINFSVPPKGKYAGVPCHLSLKISEADFSRLVRFVSQSIDKSKEYSGSVSGYISIDFESGKDLVKSLNGKGAARVNDGQVFILPLFGGLSNFMMKIVPGLGFVLSQNDALFVFDIKDGTLISDTLKIEGDVLSLKGRGSYRIGDNLDLYVQVKLLKNTWLGGKIFRALTYPLSKLFEFKVTGPIGNPHWYPVNFSLDVFRRSGNKGSAK